MVSDIERRRVRQQLGFPDHSKILCYVGSALAWQKISSIVGLCRGMALANTNCRFLFLTLDVAAIQGVIARIGLDASRCHVTSCPHTGVHDYLQAGDAGILMRDDTLVNNVACPVKIGEYLSAGLPVLLSRGIGDMSDLIAKHGVGLVIEDSPSACLRALEFLNCGAYEEVSRRCRLFVEKHLTWSAYSEEFRQLYSY